MGGPSSTTPTGPRRQGPAEAGGSSPPSGGSQSGGGRTGQGGGGQGLGGGASGGGTPGGAGECPDIVLASLTGPIQGLSMGMTLRVVLDEGPPTRRALVVDPVADRTVGSIGGIPDLKRLLDCLAAGVAYRAVITAIDGGRIELRVVRQDD